MAAISIIVGLSPAFIGQTVGYEDVLYGVVAIGQIVGEGHVSIDGDSCLIVVQCRGEIDVGLSEILVACCEVVGNAELLRTVNQAVVGIQLHVAIHPCIGES